MTPGQESAIILLLSIACACILIMVLAAALGGGIVELTNVL